VISFGGGKKRVNLQIHRIRFTEREELAGRDFKWSDFFGLEQRVTIGWLRKKVNTTEG